MPRHMQGLNLDIILYRAAHSTDDDAGGAQKQAYIQYATGRGRLQQRPVSVDLRAQGLGTDRLFDCFIQPATIEVQNMDMLIPTNGPWAHARFLITGIIKPSIEHLGSPMSHLRLNLERWDEGHMIDIQ